MPVVSKQETWRAPPPPAPERLRVGDEYPAWFASAAWSALLTGDVNEAARHYKACVRRDAADAEGWYGTAAVALVRGQPGEAAAAFVKGWVLDRKFPIGRFLRDVCPEDPELWYRFAGALVALRRKSAYHCADLALATVMAEDSSPHALRQRASRVRVNISTALEAREVSDLRSVDRGTSPGGLSRAVLQSLGIVLVLAVAVGVGMWMFRDGKDERVAPPLPTAAGGAQPDTPPSPAPRLSSPASPEGTASPASAPGDTAGASRAAPSAKEGAAPSTPSSPTEEERGLPSSTPSGDTAGEDGVATPSSVPSGEVAGEGGARGAPSGEETGGGANAAGSGAPAVQGTGSAVDGGGPADATIHVSDDHGNGHSVKLNGQVVGKTPLTLIVRPGVPATIIVTSGKRPWQIRLKPSPGEVRRLEAELPN